MDLQQLAAAGIALVAVGAGAFAAFAYDQPMVFRALLGVLGLAVLIWAVSML